MPVVSSDGERLGTVHRVQDNAREHIFDGIVMRTGDGMRFVDAPEVDRITLRQVTLNIDAAQARELPGAERHGIGAGPRAARPGAAGGAGSSVASLRPMDAYLAVVSKREVRDYLARPLEPEVERQILDAGRVAGSAKNRQPWTFIVDPRRQGRRGGRGVRLRGPERARRRVRGRDPDDAAAPASTPAGRRRT